MLIFCRGLVAIWCFSCLRVCLFSVYPHEDVSPSEAGALPCVFRAAFPRAEGEVVKTCSSHAWGSGSACEGEHTPRVLTTRPGVPGDRGAATVRDVIQWVSWPPLCSTWCRDLSLTMSHGQRWLPSCLWRSIDKSGMSLWILWSHLADRICKN